LRFAFHANAQRGRTAARLCGCTSTETAMLIAANTPSWIVAMSGSYVMNSFITFAAESGRRLRWRDYVTFAASGIAGAVTNTATAGATSVQGPVDSKPPR